MKKIILRLVIVVALSLLMAGVSCKTQPVATTTAVETTKTTESTTTSAETTMTTKIMEIVKIGALQDLSGPTSVWGNAVKRGIELAIEDINTAGGINGAKLELVAYDVKLDPQEAINAYNRLVDQDKVIAVAGPPISNIGLALDSVAEEKKVPIVGSFMDPRVTVKEDGSVWSYMFLMQPTTKQYSEILADYTLKELGLKKVAVFFDQSNAYTVSLVEPFKEYIKNNGGEIIIEQVFKAGDKDFKTQLNKIKESGAEVLFAPNYIQDNVITLQQADQIGLNVPIIGAFDFAPPFVKVLGDSALADNIYFLNNYSESEPQLQELRTKYVEKYNEEPVNKVYLGYDKVLIIADAIKRANSLDPIKVKEGLETVKELKCTTGVITISPKTHSPIGLSMVVYKIENGEYKELGRYIPESQKQ